MKKNPAKLEYFRFTYLISNKNLLIDFISPGIQSRKGYIIY